MAGESTLRLKLEDFGTFVIFTAIYAAGTLGLPKIPLLAYQIKIGEMPSAFVAIFGMPAVLGLTLGQFIANLGVEASPIASLSPLFSFIDRGRLLSVHRPVHRGHHRLLRIRFGWQNDAPQGTGRK